MQHITSTAQGSYRSGDLSKARDAVQRDLKEYLKVSYPTFIRSIFGFSLPDATHIPQKLANANVLDRTMTKWNEFTVTPTQSDSCVFEGDTFKPLVNIISVIFDQIPNCKVSVVENLTKTPLSERQNPSCPDAYIVRESRAAKEEIHWFDISFEFKKAKDDTSEEDNEKKIVWNMHNVMREDPCRRFALGITIEGTDMKLWCNSRAVVATSEPINFLTEVDKVISLFYTIGKSTEVRLGWDPTIKRIHQTEGIQYRFEICGRSFTTTRLLALYGADEIVGRGTRVYEARDEDRNFIAIKDSWRDEDRDPEGAILERIFDDMEGKLEEIEITEAKKYFVAVWAYEDVIVSRQSDKTFNFGNDKSKFAWIHVNVPQNLSRKRQLPSKGHQSDTVLPPRKFVGRSASADIPRRIHTRTIFEVGIPLIAVTSLADYFICLSGAQKALYYLHKAGWVHRDFSIGNLLKFETDGEPIGKLMDFEFAKKVDSNISHEERTGTMNFMAVEVERRTYLFVPEDDDLENHPPFRMNFLHDLESLWWAAIWILFYHTDKNSPTEDPDAQLSHFIDIFPSEIAQATRYQFFTIHKERLLASQNLSNTYRDTCTGAIGLARDLRACYRKAEKSYPAVKLDNDLLEDAHRKVSDVLCNAAKKLKDSDIQLTPVHKLLEEKSDSSRDKKRARHE